VNAKAFRSPAGTEAPRVTAVVLNFNGERTIERCIQSVVNQDYDNFHIVLVDNASRDRSLELVAPYGSKINFICNSSNLGYAGGMNVGADSSPEGSEFVAFVTQDVVLSDHWIREMVDLAIGGVDIGAVSSSVYDEKKKAIISELRILYPSGQYQIPLNATPSVSDVDFPSGEAFLIRRSVFRNIGGFDDEYFAYYDDGDLGWRVRLAGLRVVFNPEAKVTHMRSSAFELAPFAYRVYLHERNRMVTCLKNLGSPSLLAFLASEIFTIFFHLGRALARKDLNQASKAYARALAYVIMNLERIRGKRRIVQSARKRSDRYLFRGGMPLTALRRPSLAIAYLPRYRRIELWYLAALYVVSRIFPPNGSLAR